MAHKQTLVDPATGQEIPDYLRGLKGVSTGHDIPTLGQSFIMLASRPGKGKSTLVNSNPKAFVVDVGWGGKTVKEPKSIRFGPIRDQKTGHVHRPSLNDYRDAINRVIEAKRRGANDFETVVIDTVNDWVALHTRELLQRNNVLAIRQVAHGNGYDEIKNFLALVLSDIQAIGLGVVTTVHVQARNIRTADGDTTVYGIALWDSVREMLNGPCDHQMYLDQKTMPVYETKHLPGGKQKEVLLGTREVRYIEAHPSGNFKPGHFDDGKVRVPFDDEIVISETNGWADLEAAYARAVERLTAKSAQ